MFPNTHRRGLQFVLAAGFLVLPTAAAHADNTRRTPPEQTGIKLEDLVQLKVEIVEVTTKTLTAAKDEISGSRQIIDAVRKAVENGTARVRYTLETPMLVGRPLSLTASAREPFVSGRKAAKDGKSNAQTRYEDIGCTINVRTKWVGSTPEAGVHVSWNVQLSDVRTSSGVRMADDYWDAPVFISQRFTIDSLLAVGETIAFRAGIQRPRADESMTSVVIARLTANPRIASTE